MSSFIKYIIPEDGDDLNHPNVFFVASNQPTLGDMRKAFPVPGDYHFRFLRSIGEMKVWMDINEDSLVLPIVDGSIFAKVSRVSIPAPSSSSAREQVSVPSSSKQPSVTPPSSVSASAPIQSPQPQPVESNTKSPQPAPARRNSEKLLKFDDDIESPHPNVPAKAATAASSDLLGFDTPITSSAPTTNIDLFGLETLQPTMPMSAGSTSLPPPMQLRQPAPMAGPMSSMGANGNRMAGSNSPAPMGGSNYNPMGGVQRSGPMGGNGFDAFSGLGGPAVSGRGGIPPQQQQAYAARGPMGQNINNQQRR